jgi:endonuclease-8
VPEGHTVHRLAREQLRLFGGRPWRAASPQGRFAAGAALLDGRVLRRTEAFGKHLFYVTDDPEARLHVHLGLYGAWTTGAGAPPPPRGAVRLRLSTGTDGAGGWADLRGPTVCEVVTRAGQDAVTARLGPDPLRRDAVPLRACERIVRSRAPIGALLMDQSVVAGVGNVFRAEVLYRQAIEPHRPGRDVSPQEVTALWDDLVVLLRAGVRAGRIVTTLPADRSRRSGPPTLADAHYVYRRQGLPCRRCGTGVRAEPFVGRTLYWCPVCQPS